MKFAIRGRKPKQDYSLLNWQLGTGEIAKLLNITEGNASRLRRKYAPETINQNKNKDKIKYHVDWKKINWHKKTKDIALDLSVPYETVNQMRRKHAKWSIKKRVFLNLDKLG